MTLSVLVVWGRGRGRGRTRVGFYGGMVKRKTKKKERKMNEWSTRSRLEYLGSCWETEEKGLPLLQW
jgi:hypothetical protein